MDEHPDTSYWCQPWNSNLQLYVYLPCFSSVKTSPGVYQCRLDIEDVGTMMTCKRDFDARVDEIIGKRPVQGRICQWWRICQWFNRSTYFSFDDFGTKPSLGSSKIIMVKSLLFRLKFKRLVPNHWLKSLTGTGRNPVKSLVLTCSKPKKNR